MLELEQEQWREALEKRGMKVSRAKTEYVSKWNAIRKCSYAICPAATCHGIKISASDGDMKAEVNKRTQCGWNNWMKMSDATIGYHLTLRERFTRSLFSQLCCMGWRQC